MYMIKKTINTSLNKCLNYHYIKCYTTNTTNNLFRNTFVFDLETSELIGNVRNKKAKLERIRELNMTVGIGLYFSNGFKTNINELKINRVDCILYPYEQKYQHKNKLQQLATYFDKADDIVIYNRLSFDLPVLEKYYIDDKLRFKSWINKIKDPYNIILKCNGDKYISLSKLIEKNGIGIKDKSGLDAPNLWKNQQYNDLIDYCYNDTICLLKLWHKIVNNEPIKIKLGGEWIEMILKY